MEVGGGGDVDLHPDETVIRLDVDTAVVTKGTSTRVTVTLYCSRSALFRATCSHLAPVAS